jgi:excisionase family DNA binding protein
MATEARVESAEGLSTSTLWTADEVARRLGVPTSWVYEQSRCGRIPTVTLGRYRRYRPEAIDAWIRGLEAGDGNHTGPRRRRFSK